MSAQVPICPTCKKEMRPERPFIEYETKPEETGIGEPFPPRIEMKMFENYVCYECGTRTRQAVRVATYKSPEIKELVPP